MPVHLSITASLLPVLYSEAEHTRNYEHFCNEQLSSKLKSLLMQKKIAGLLKQSFDYDNNIKDIIKKLNERKAGNLWGWWQGSAFKMWISKNVVEALLQARQAGFNARLDTIALKNSLILQAESPANHELAYCIDLLMQLKASANYPIYIGKLEKWLAETADKKHPNQYAWLQLYLLKQKVGLPVPLDSILNKRNITMLGNYYWNDESYDLFNNSIHSSLLVYKMVRHADSASAVLPKIRGFLLEQRRNGHWRNTYESAAILETILPDLIRTHSSETHTRVTLQDGTVIKQFPYTATLPAASAIQLRKQGSLPAYISVYQQYFDKASEKAGDAFAVSTSFMNSQQQPVAIHNNRSSITAGEEYILEAKVQVKKNAEYVMIEIPIPAGCSYDEKYTGYNEEHREYYKNKVCIFASTLTAGTYRYTVKLTPRYTGIFHLNPATASLMYFPVLYGREAVKKVEVR